MTSTTSAPTDSDAVALTGATPTAGVLLVTNGDQNPDESYAFTVALTLAAKNGVPVTLYDRSEETWGDSQHPDGPMRPDDDRLADRPELCSQITWLDDHGVHGQGWVSTLPSISAVLTALANVEADVVVVPGDLDRNLFERALEGGSLASTIAEQISRNDQIQAVVVEIDENGAADVVSAP